MADVKQLGARIKRRREELNLTLEDVSKAVGVAKTTIMRYENGEISRPKIPVIHSIANALGVRPQWILGESDQMEDEEQWIWNGDTLKELRISSGISSDALAANLGISASRYRSVESSTERPTVPLLEAMANCLHSSVDVLIGRKTYPVSAPYSASTQDEDKAAQNFLNLAQGFTSRPNYSLAPLLGSVPISDSPNLYSHILSYLPVFKEVGSGDYFWLRINDDSMIQADIRSGDYILFKKQSSASQKDIVLIVENNQSAIIARYYSFSDHILLERENIALSPTLITKDLLSQCDICIRGVAVAQYRNFASPDFDH